jgi:hypothetical protein
MDEKPIKKAVYTLHQMSEDEKIREIARVREKALHDEATLLATARREGISAVARNALSMGFETDEIVKLTGLSRGEIEALR